MKLAQQGAGAFRASAANTGGKFIGSEVKSISTGIVGLSRGAESANASVNLSRKLSLLESFPKDSIKNRLLPDGRIRYYASETPSRMPGPTRGGGNVVEWNPKSGKVRGWYECYDHFGNVNRVHPKNINGQIVSSPHYPPTASDLIK